MSDQKEQVSRVEPSGALRPQDPRVNHSEVRSYDENQRAAMLLTWLCCRRTVYATNPAIGCGLCR